MKKLFSTLLILSVLFITGAHAQNTPLLARSCELRTQKGTIRQLLDTLSRSTNITIEWAAASIDTGKMVALANATLTLEQVLRQILKGQFVSLAEKNGKIILVPAAEPLADNSHPPLFSVFGFVKDAASKEPLSEATVMGGTNYNGVRSNNHGYFTLLLPAGKETVWISYAGYKGAQLDFTLTANKRIDIELTPNSNMEEVTVASRSGEQHPGGASNLQAKESAFNRILGEPDAMYSTGLLPGVNLVPESWNGLMVRGGSPDQNILLLDGNPIFNPTHLLGTVSIINPTSLKSFYLYKSSFPARFGGALSSVMDVSAKDGNMRQWKGEVNAGLLAGSFTLEGPLKKDRTAIMLAFRNSWINPFLRLLKTGFDVRFYDAHFKLTQLLGAKDKLMINAYAGHDKLNLLKDNINNQQQWGNRALSLTWNRVLGPRAFVNSSMNISDYQNRAGFRYFMADSSGTGPRNRAYNTFSSLQQYTLRTEAEWYTSNTVKYNFGGHLSFTRIRPFNTNVAADFADGADELRAFPPLNFAELALFYENEIRMGRFFFRPGVYTSVYKYGSFRTLLLQPRFYASYQLSNFHQLNVSYNRMAQNLHLVTNPYLGINSDAWVPSTALLKPEGSNLINIGYRYSGPKKLVVTAEVYYKQMQRVTNYVDGKDLFLNNADWEQSLQSGKGWSYGLEGMMQKKTPRWQAQLSYTLSWNQRQFRDINGGRKFPFKYDRRHVLNLAATYNAGSRWQCSMLWSFATGDVYTLPDKIYADFDVAQQIIDPLAPQEYRLIYYSSAVNQYRTRPYHRMDVSAAYRHQVIKKTHSLFTAGIYNVYGSPSQYVYDLEGRMGKKSLIVTSSYKFFGITPYLSYSLIF
ncbi:MAG: TonB-dependent receptor [Williamsia sp.]|nr:TonB-dependent receptor [Williamsia sp.]